MNTPRTFAVIVTYGPDRARLAELCKQLGWNAEVIVVDNTPSLEALGPLADTQWLSMGRNVGIAAAQNAGIRAALECGAGAVAFFDQDSRPEAVMLPTLIQALANGCADIVSPICIDSHTTELMPGYRISRLGMPVRVVPMPNSPPVNVDLTISSGTVVHRRVLDAGLLMDESLFIDFVDFEWCLRCRAHGFTIALIPTAQMLHRIGERSIESAGLRSSLHSATRSYYKIRNPLLLLRKRYVPSMYALREAMIAVLQAVLVMRIVKNRTEYFSAFLSGIRDGLFNRTGPKLQNQSQPEKIPRV